MQGLKEHSDWWALLTFDGFKSHVNVTQMLQKFLEHFIRVAKEEGGTSATNQFYDQEQAIKDKMHTRRLLDLARRAVTGHIIQWQLVGIIAVAINNLGGKIWERSFKAVNLHPKHRFSFEDWIKKIEPSIKTGEHAYFCTNKEHFFDAMSVFWKKMSVDDGCQVVRTIPEFVVAAPAGLFA